MYNEQNKEVYRWSNNKAFTAALSKLDLKKDEKLSYTEVWNLQDDQGKPVPSGNYTISLQILVNSESQTIHKDDLTNQLKIQINQ
ncbi:hypothetical protein G9U52_12325 [Paenibacillus sp. S3N08]|uniref:Intracellular proteinase inhibitor BsuPI domain-containing protein n=1 Tax=Paenibacillus agricola TaxID=2716264 RepID=A0ABX0J4P4_9BACL|nr:hypothetical protein [Paenibacillus agricola]